MEIFVVVTHFGGLVYGPFAHYGDAEVAAKNAEPSSGHPLKVEKFFTCHNKPADEKFCPECIRVIKERGEKAEAALKMGSKLGVSLKLHA